MLKMIKQEKNTTNIIDTEFPSRQRSFQHARGIKDKGFNQRSGREFLFKLNRYLTEDTSNAMNFIRTQISALNKLSLKDITRSIDDELIRLSPPF